MDAHDGNGEPHDRDETAIPSQEELFETIENVRLSPTEHQRIKDLINEDLNEIKGYDRRYLSVGAGGTTGAATRRKMVYDMLDARTSPPAVAFRLEDYDLTPDEIRLWTRTFDILCGRATHIVAVIEDFNGGYVWELGLLFAPSYRKQSWVLKRNYTDPQTERNHYENGMAASHVTLLLTGPQCYEWRDRDELRESVSEIP